MEMKKKIAASVVGVAIAAGGALVARKTPPMVNPMPSVCFRQNAPPLPCPGKGRR